jgi:hypothetical protein
MAGNFGFENETATISPGRIRLAVERAVEHFPGHAFAFSVPPAPDFL